MPLLGRLGGTTRRRAKTLLRAGLAAAGRDRPAVLISGDSLVGGNVDIGNSLLYLLSDYTRASVVCPFMSESDFSSHPGSSRRGFWSML